MNSATYMDALDDVESLSYSKLLKEIEQIEGLWGMHLLHFFDRLFIESSPLRTDHPQKPREIYQLLSILLSVDNSEYHHPFSYIYT